MSRWHPEEEPDYYQRPNRQALKSANAPDFEAQLESWSAVNDVFRRIRLSKPSQDVLDFDSVADMAAFERGDIY